MGLPLCLSSQSPLGKTTSHILERLFYAIFIYFPTTSWYVRHMFCNRTGVSLFQKFSQYFKIHRTCLKSSYQTTSKILQTSTNMSCKQQPRLCQGEGADFARPNHGSLCVLLGLRRCWRSFERSKGETTSGVGGEGGFEGEMK